MAKSSAEYYEVRWRVSGSGEAWSAPQRVDPNKEIVVEDLDRSKTYEFEARAVSACGARSDWAASTTHAVPPPPPDTIKLPDVKDTANKGVSLVTQLPVINGGFDWDTPAGYGWTADSGTGWTFDRAGNTPGVGPNCAMRAAGTGTDTGAYRNIGLMGCQAGQTVKVQGLVKTVGVTGTVYVFISWLDAGLNEIGSTAGNQITGSTTAGSYAVGQAPTGTVYAKACLGYSNMTAGTCYVDNVLCTQHPASVDEVPDGASYGRAPISGAYSEQIVDNADWTSPIDASGKVPGWEVFGSNVTGIGYADPSDYPGTNALEFTTSSATAGGFLSKRTYPVEQGDFVQFSAMGVPYGGGVGLIQIRAYDKAGGVVGNGATGTTSGSALTWYPITATYSVPSGVSYVRLLLYTATAQKIRFRKPRVYINDVRVSGSGAQLGGQRNMPYVSWGNYGGMWSGLSLTYSTTTTSCTFSASSGSYVGGDDSIAYNASSVTVNGTAGSTVTYYLYYDDPTMSGGSKSLQATTSQINSLNANGRVLVNQVSITYPTSGTGSGGGTVGCPQVDEPVIRRAPDGSQEVIRAGDVREGDDLLSPSGRWVRVSYSEAKLQPCVRVAFADGEARVFSASAPLEDATGRPVLAPFAKGRVLRHRTEGAMRVADVNDAGTQWVQHITAENDYFLVGNFSHHNRKPAV